MVVLIYFEIIIFRVWLQILLRMLNLLIQKQIMIANLIMNSFDQKFLLNSIISYYRIGKNYYQYCRTLDLLMNLAMITVKVAVGKRIMKMVKSLPQDSIAVTMLAKPEVFQ